LTHFNPELVSWPSAMFAEGLGTAILIIVVLGLTARSAPIGWAGLIIGLTVTAIDTTLGPITGGAINPARALGPLFVSTVAGSVHNWDQWIGYLLAELIGGCLAAVVYVYVSIPHGAQRRRT
jgi:glycerol uptake facilitator-like aquaporin